MSRTSVWTPRRTHKLWPLPAGSLTPSRAARTYHPQVSPEWRKPPKPSWGKKKEVVTEHVVTVEELSDRAQDLRQQSEALSGNAPAPSIRVQLGQILLAMDTKGFEAMLKKWDVKGRGEFIKAEMRLNLRNTGLNVTSAESDALFDTWDDDGGGSLDLKELRGALASTQKSATEFNNRPDPAQQKIQRLLKRAALADEAAEVTSQANGLEQALEEYSQELLSRADVRLGSLLQKRMIKPGEVVVHWAKSKGEHAGELSKADFRRAVLDLFKGRQKESKTKRMSPREDDIGEEGSPRVEIVTSPSEIDAVRLGGFECSACYFSAPPLLPLLRFRCLRDPCAASVCCAHRAAIPMCSHASHSRTGRPISGL